MNGKFQSTLPQGERRLRFYGFFQFLLFQSTLPQGGRLPPTIHSHPGQAVSIHAPAGGATRVLLEQIPPVIVSIHAPAGGATFWDAGVYADKMFQSTLPQGERRAGSRGADRGGAVSIHAPAGGATGPFWLTSLVSNCFNPRSRRGSDSDLLTS